MYVSWSVWSRKCRRRRKKRRDEGGEEVGGGEEAVGGKRETARKLVKMIREFLNMVYSSLYMGAGASCSTSVDLVTILRVKFQN